MPMLEEEAKKRMSVGGMNKTEGREKIPTLEKGGKKMITQQETYLRRCCRCFKETPHIIYKINLKKGIKLKCLTCGNYSTRYLRIGNLNKLQEVKNENLRM